MPAMTATQLLSRLLAEIPNADVPDFLYLLNGMVEWASTVKRWRFYQETYQFDTTPAYNTGTVSLTEGSADVTGSGTTFTSGMVGRKFSVSGYPGVYEIESRTSDTLVTLSRVWASDSLTDSEYSIFQNAYSLPANCRSVIDVRSLRTGEEVCVKTRTDSLIDWASFIEPQLTEPHECVQFGSNDNGQNVLLFDGVTESADPIEITYYRWPTALTSMSSTVDAPTFLHEYIYLCLLERMVMRFRPQDPALQEYVRSAKIISLSAARGADATLVSPVMRNRANRSFL